MCMRENNQQGLFFFGVDLYSHIAAAHGFPLWLVHVVFCHGFNQSLILQDSFVQ
jgi:hypothetical protein